MFQNDGFQQLIIWFLFVCSENNIKLNCQKHKLIKLKLIDIIFINKNMKQKANQRFQQNAIPNYRFQNSQFRIRSSSKGKSLGINKKNGQNSVEKRQNYNQIMERLDDFEKFKVSQEQLTNVYSHTKHHRRRSNVSQQPYPVEILEEEDHLKKTNLQISDVDPLSLNDDNKKIVYESVRTEETHLNKKPWLDVNGIDTSENIKMLDRIATLYDPFRIINECNSKKNTDKKILEESRQKSNSTKRSKLTDKINNLVFDVHSKSKQKNSYDLDYKKFGSLSRPNSECKNYEQVGDPQKNKNIFRKGISTPKLPKRKGSALLNQEKQSDGFCNQIGKSQPLQKYTKNLLFGTSQNRPKRKINVDQLKESKRNDAMDNYWSEVNESLILASQDSYVSQDLNDLVYNNMH